MKKQLYSIVKSGGSEPTLIEKSITGNGVYNASDDSADGYSKATVNVPPTLFRKLVNKSITEVTAEDLGSLTVIGEYAFYICRSLKSATIPDTLTNINSHAFCYCSGLLNLTIGSGVRTISGNYNFNGCSQLTQITIKAINPPTLSGTNAFDNTNNCPIYVPADSVNAYKTATNWSALASRIQAIPA